jgi:transposase
MQVTTIGIDLAKHVFQIHGVEADGGVVVRRKLRRSEVIGFLAKLPPALIGMEMLLVGQIRDTQVRVTEIEKRIMAWHRASDVSRRLETIPGIARSLRAQSLHPRGESGPEKDGQMKRAGSRKSRSLGC